MDVHEKFYGQAMNEFDQGIRREDLWAKALTVSNWDMQKAKSTYIDLLAKRLAETAVKDSVKVVAKSTLNTTHEFGRDVGELVTALIPVIVIGAVVLGLAVTALAALKLI